VIMPVIANDEIIGSSIGRAEASLNDDIESKVRRSRTVHAEVFYCEAPFLRHPSWFGYT
jgi:hypothetical protein